MIRDRNKELIRIRAGDLIPNPRNWRRHPKAQADAMRGVLADVGFAGAAIARQTPEGLMLLDGHLRAELDPEAIISVIVLEDDVTDEDAAKILLTHDPLGAMAETGSEALASLLAEVRFGDGAAMAMLQQLARDAKLDTSKDGLTDPDDVPPVPDDPVTKPGDLWLLGEHRLLCGDATRADDVARLMGGEKAAALVTDPPYGMNLDTDWSGVRRTGQSLGRRKDIEGKAYPPVTGDDVAFDPAPVLELIASGVKEVFLFGPDYYTDRIPDRESGSWLVWDKRKENQAEGFGSEFELIWSRQRHKKRVLRHMSFGFLREGEQGQSRSHPTQKPITLIEDIITQWCDGEIIADPFLGSGSTLIACERLGRRCYGVEIEPRYVDVAVRRWEEYTGKKAVLDGRL